MLPGFDTVLLLAHAAATWAMVGLIWFVQVVHYPLFAAVGTAESRDYARLHQRRTTFVVGPPMLVELATAAWIAWRLPAGVSPALAWSGLALVAVVWASTHRLQVPEHARLLAGRDDAVIRRLVRGNWLRTAAWTARGAIALAMLLR